MKKALIFLALIFFTQSILTAQVTEGFEDDFIDDSGAWPEYNNDKLYCKVENGQYIIEHKRKKEYWTFTKSIFVDPGRDFYIEAKMTQLSGVDDGYGILFGMSDIKNYYCFLVSDGKYLLGGLKNNVSFSPKEWSKSDAINDKKTANILGIKKSGGQISFLVNGKIMFTQDYQNFFGLTFGFVVNSKMKVTVNYLKVKQTNTINLVKNLNTHYKKENLGSNVNSPYGEIGPIITQNGKTLYIDRYDHPENTPGDENNDIWISHNVNGTWEPAKNIGRPLNNKNHNFVLSISPDENTMLVNGIYNQDGETTGPGLSITHRTATGWEIPRKLEIENYYSDGNEISFNLSADRKTLIMAVERKDTYGENDLYVSFLKNDDTWTRPMNMGSSLNTLGDEATPYLAADGVTLYFSSSGRPGYGAGDIFVCKRLDDSWTNWSKPLNLGPEINGKDWELYFSTTANGEYGYLVSGQQSIGHEDIFRIKLADEVKPEPVVIIYGKVLDKETGKPLEAEITYYNLNTNQEVGIARTNPIDGSYKIILPYGQAYGFHADKNGYYSESSSIDLTEIKTYTEIERNLLLAPIKAGNKIALNNVFFEQSKPVLLPTSYGELDRLVQILMKNPTIKIEIEGHTDNVGDPKKNQKLSEDRVKTIKNYLINKGISANRLTGKGYGGSKPIASNAKEETRKLNRRVEFTIISM